MARTKQALADSFIKLNEEAQKAGLVINVNKTKYMKCSRNQVKEQIVELKLEMYNHLNYLESVVNTNNTLQEIKERISAGNKAYFAHIYV
jgi:hypothetical protein